MIRRLTLAVVLICLGAGVGQATRTDQTSEVEQARQFVAEYAAIHKPVLPKVDQHQLDDARILFNLSMHGQPEAALDLAREPDDVLDALVSELGATRTELGQILKPNLTSMARGYLELAREKRDDRLLLEIALRFFLAPEMVRINLESIGMTSDELRCGIRVLEREHTAKAIELQKQYGFGPEAVGEGPWWGYLEQRNKLERSARNLADLWRLYRLISHQPIADERLSLRITAEGRAIVVH